jgi:hypothetical protein
MGYFKAHAVLRKGKCNGDDRVKLFREFYECIFPYLESRAVRSCHGSLLQFLQYCDLTLGYIQQRRRRDGRKPFLILIQSIREDLCVPHSTRAFIVPCFQVSPEEKLSWHSHLRHRRDCLSRDASWKEKGKRERRLEAWGGERWGGWGRGRAGEGGGGRGRRLRAPPPPRPDAAASTPRRRATSPHTHPTSLIAHLDAPSPHGRPSTSPLVLRPL